MSTELTKRLCNRKVNQISSIFNSFSQNLLEKHFDASKVSLFERNCKITRNEQEIAKYQFLFMARYLGDEREM